MPRARINLSNNTNKSDNGDDNRNDNGNDNKNINKDMNQKQRSNQDKAKGGLNVELHPFLKDIVSIPQIPKNHNPLKRNVRSTFDSSSINPYLEPGFGGGGGRKKRSLQFNEKGKYIEEGEKLRENIRKQQQEDTKVQNLKDKGLLVNEELGENLYHKSYPPNIEWWDTFYLRKNNYEFEEKDLVLDNEISPISIYIQHPVFIDAPNERHMPKDRAMYLTKKELKRKRKNERQERFKLQRERVKLGLEAPPPPKVKLSNLMNVLTNEAIKDPTAVEKRVKRDIENRYKQHIKSNEERKLTKEQKHEKIHQQHEEDLNKGFYRNVYRIDKLIDKQHFFKISKNAQQLELKGICIVDEKMTLLVIEGGNKSMKFYDKLLMNRIDWNKSDKFDLSNNKIYKIWSGQIKDLYFKKWSILTTHDDNELYSILNRFDIENYWRQSINFE